MTTLFMLGDLRRHGYNNNRLAKVSERSWSCLKNLDVCCQLKTGNKQQSHCQNDYGCSSALSLEHDGVILGLKTTEAVVLPGRTVSGLPFTILFY